jgi:phosphatase NudJ
MTSIATTVVALVVCRDDAGRFLVVEERDGSLYLPAGRVEPGETLIEAAKRETREESGVEVEPFGVLRVEYTPGPYAHARLRVWFAARPIGGAPKTTADEHSRGAAFMTLDALRRGRVRHQEAIDVFEHVDRGGSIHPLDVLVLENSPWVR